MTNLDFERVTALSESDLELLVRFDSGFELYADHDAIRALRALQHDAKSKGFNLQPCSAFRSFERQCRIFLDKFEGRRQILDENEVPISDPFESEADKIRAILLFSALPGFSRHHFGSDFDVYDPDLIPPGEKLRLTYHEYLKGSYFHEFGEYLKEALPRFDFLHPYVPPENSSLPESLSYANGKIRVGREMWHISYAPVAKKRLNAFDPQAVLDLICGSDLPFAPYVKEVMTEEQICATLGLTQR